MNATLTMSCACGLDGFNDDDLALSDAARIRTWTMLHNGPGHTVTAVVVASYDTLPSQGAPLARVHHIARNLHRALTGLLRY